MAKPNPRRQNGHRRNLLRARVLGRDTHCWWCKKPVDRNLPPRLEGSPEVHELIAVSRGGSPYDPDNCVLTHRACNLWISNRTPAELAALTAERVPVRTGFAW